MRVLYIEMNRDPAVSPECIAYYNKLKTTSQDTLRIIEKITGNNAYSFQTLGNESSLLPAVCTTLTTQKAAHDQWNTDINALWTTIKDIPIPDSDMSVGGSQKGGADCPEDFQKIFNYMFLIAASASIAIMSPDIELVANVCMKAVQLVFGTIALPILNLLRVVFLFMLQSLVLIVKTAGSVAIQLISNFIKTVYLNIHTITSGAIGIAKVFIYRSLTYCKSFYNKVVAAMPKEQEDNKIADIIGLKIPPTIPSTITNLSQIEVGEINKSMNEAVNTEFLGKNVIINITEERDIFMDMLTKLGDTYDAIRKQIKFVYTFIQTAYLLVCNKAHNNLVSVLGSHYSANHAKLLLTKAILNVEIFVIHALNAPGISMYYIKDAFLRLLKSVHSETDPLFDQGDESIDTNKKDESKNMDKKDESKLVNVINAALKNITDDNAKSNTEEIVNKADDNIMTLFKPPEPVANEGNKKRKLVENPEYAIIMERLNKQLDEIRDRNTPDVVMDQSNGGSKKRRTKKAKKRGNKRRYSRKH